MVDPVLSQAGKKGAAIRRAKKQAQETGQEVELPEHGVVVREDGEIRPLEGPAKAQQIEDAEVDAAMGAAHEEEVDEKPGEVIIDHLEGKGFMIGERMPGGEYRHIARAASREVVEEYMRLMDLGIAKSQAIDHLNERHGDGSITPGTNLPYATKGIDSGADLISRAEEASPPTPPKMAPLTEPGVEAEEKAVYQPEDVPFSVGIEAPDQPKAILDAVAEAEPLVERPGGPITATEVADIERENAEEAYHDKGDRMAALAEEVEEGPIKPSVPLPNTVLARAFYYVEYNGLSEADALSLAQIQLGKQGPGYRDATQPATPGEGETLGPDKTMVEAYQKRMETYVAPRLECEIKVENPVGDDWVFPMPVRFLDYLLRSAEWETIKRRREVTPADRLQQILREYRRDDQEVRLLMAPGAASGPAGTFNPASGHWE